MSNFVKPSKDEIDKNQEKNSPLPKHQKFITLVDEETGKTIGMFPLKSKNLGKGWIALYQEASIWLSSQRLTGEQYSVMLFLFGKLDFENYLRIGLQEISDRTGIKLPNVSRAMRKLKELNIILEGPPEGKFKTYRLNPYIAHKGSERKQTIIDFEKLLEKKSEPNADNDEPK